MDRLIQTEFNREREREKTGERKRREERMKAGRREQYFVVNLL